MPTIILGKTLKEESLLDDAYDVAGYNEKIRLEDGIYPIIKSGDSVPGLFQEFKKEIYYESDGKSYKLLLISNYIVRGCHNYTAIKIIDGSIYWKDNFVKKEESINNINWDKVSHLVVNVKKNENGEFLDDRPIDFPGYIR